MDNGNAIFAIRDRVRLRGDLSPWKHDPQRGAVGVVMGTCESAIVVKFWGYDGKHHVLPDGLQIVSREAPLMDAREQYTQAYRVLRMYEVWDEFLYFEDVNFWMSTTPYVLGCAIQSLASRFVPDPLNRPGRYAPRNYTFALAA